MRMHALFFIAALTPLFDGQAAAQDDAEGEKSIRLTPCSSWSYSSEANGYVCRFTGYREEVPDMMEFRRLEQRVRDLEQAVRNLEMKLGLTLER